MKECWVNQFLGGASVAKIEAKSAQEALQIALELYPLDSNGEFQGQFRSIVEKSPFFVTVSKPDSEYEVLTSPHTFTYHMDWSDEQKIYNVRQHYEILSSTPVTAESANQAIKTATVLEETRPYGEEGGYWQLLYTSPMFVTIETEVLETEEAFFNDDD